MKVRKVKVFKNGGSKAIRIPAEFFPDAGELYLWRDDRTQELMLSEQPPRSPMDKFLSWVDSRPTLSAEEQSAFAIDPVLDDWADPLSRNEEVGS